MLFKSSIFAMVFLCIALAKLNTSKRPIWHNHNSTKAPITSHHHGGKYPNGKKGGDHPLIKGRHQNGDHSLIEGSHESGEQLLRKYEVQKSPESFQIVEATVQFPEKGEENQKRINYLKVIDNKQNSYNGYPSIAIGGVGHKNVTINFKSQSSRGIDFTVHIYGQ